ncbi:hypothetical protein CAI21_22430 [Alkalilimnicola ehrlichii]|uniref:Uncharacterized protein n=1 Tax=Alkalilimnicola ehrlichii TaxID=351052 RepID=A0A3E0WEX3_9GAMM|nr:hypothetical protein [Alkalilimnicola ehrlichii]RFA24238.1 hypothetical protein CAI21_22430 [Alkalilimnicola ehrlichii]RFA31091.1 hypothetical protein CAL65_22560 [Alkalilimnicola ehrlichii]
MKIEKIRWISEAGQEAEVHLSDGSRACVAFCQPCEYEVGAAVAGPLRAFMTKNVMLSYEQDVSLRNTNDNLFAYRCTARVIDPQHGLVCVGGLKIELDERIPAGVGGGDLVDFECARLDLW